MKFRSGLLCVGSLAVLLLTTTFASAQEAPKTEGAAPTVNASAFGQARTGTGYHVVKSGDTLFTLASFYFGTPYAWPLIWSYNDHISNPHWIYPGDVVYLRPPLPGEIPEGSGDPSPFVQSFSGTSIALGGFLTERNIKPLGKIENSPESKKMLAFPDKVYVSIEDDEKAKKGKLFAILRLDESKENEDESVTSKFRVIGAMRISEPSKDDKLHKGVIVQAWEEIYRGDLLYPYERQLLRVAPAVATKTVVGNIEDTMERQTLFGEHFYVLINKGSKDGVRAGNRFFAYTRLDGKSDLDEDDEKILPFERIAQMLVIYADEEHSTALVVESKRELDTGWHVEMYEGY